MRYDYAYPLDLRPDDGTVVATCPDVPEMGTAADTAAEARSRAVEALVVMLDHYLETGRPIPAPSPAEGRPVAVLPTAVCAKLALHAEMQRQKVTQAELARRLGVDPRQVRRMLDLTHQGRGGDVDAALAALGCRPVLIIEQAA